MAENVTELNEQEQQYFDSGGETSPEPQQEATEPQQEATEPQQEATEPQQEPERRTVDIRALHEERDRNRDLRNQLMQAQQQLSRVAELERRLQGPQAEEPSYDDNPAEYLRRRVETLEQQLQQSTQVQQQSAQMDRFRNWYVQQAQQYAQTQPDFGQAYASWTQTRMNELIESGLTAEQAQGRLISDESQLAQAAAQNGVNPASLIYQAAVAKGYKPSNIARQQATPQKNMENLARGVKASRPLSAVGGGGQSENLTWEWVANSSDDEFLENWAKMEKAEARQH